MEPNFHYNLFDCFMAILTITLFFLSPHSEIAGLGFVICFIIFFFFCA